VDSDLCISCGICVGACPTATPFRSRSALIPGIDLPNRSAADIRQDIIDQAEPIAGEQRILVFGCRDAQQTEKFRRAGANVVTVRCMAHLQPSFLDFALSRNHADGLLLLGCEDGNCNYRLGAEWLEARVARERDPRLRKRTDTSRIAIGWLAPWSNISDPAKKLDAFRTSLPNKDNDV
jgi:coenzyme F420-reducing hydrogenase delta subunit/ferredoxin